MVESSTGPGIDLESQTAQLQSSAAAISPQQGTRAVSWTQSERSLQEGLLNNTELHASVNMSAETLVYSENALSEGTPPAPGVQGEDVQLVASASQISSETLPLSQAAAAKQETGTIRTITDQNSVVRTSEYIQRISSRHDAISNTVAPRHAKTPSQISVYMGRDSIGYDDGYSLRLLDTPSDIEKDGTEYDEDGYSLRVLDMPLNGESPAKCVAECHHEAETAAVLSGLGPMDPKSARIYWSVPSREENGLGRKRLYRHLERMLGHAVQKAPHALDCPTDFGAINNPLRLRTQWGDAARPFIIELFQVEESQPEESFPYSPAYRLHKFQAHIQCIEFQEDKLVVLCQSYLQSSEGRQVKLRAWNHFVSDVYWQRNCMFKFLDGSRPRFTKLLLFYFLDAGLDWSHSRIADIKSARLELAHRTDDDTELYKDAELKCIRSVTEWQKIVLANSEVLIGICYDLASSVDYMMRHLQQEAGQQTWMGCQAAAGNTVDMTQAWKYVALDTSMSCEEVKKQSTQIFSCEQRRYELYKAQVDAKASQDATRLTTLAATFLPASLAVGFLSMQTRMKDLGPLLFDMMGVCVFIGGFAALSLGLIRLWTRVRRHGPWRTKTDRAKSIKSKWRLAMLLIYIPYLLFVTSFFVGMFASITVGIIMIAASLCLSAVMYLYYFLFR